MPQRRRRIIAVLVILLLIAGFVFVRVRANRPPDPVINGIKSSLSPSEVQQKVTDSSKSNLAGNLLETLPVKGRAPKTGYSRSQYGDGWGEVTVNGSHCDTRNFVMARDMTDVVYRSAKDCTVMSGTLQQDPYTGKTIKFVRGPNSAAVQIDHVVALSDAWQTGAQQLTKERRTQLANDPLELLAVDGPANQQKSDGDAATWLPSNKDYRCRYVARQVAVKVKYQLWVTSAERDAIRRVLATCPDQQVPQVSQ